MGLFLPKFLVKKLGILVVLYLWIEFLALSVTSFDKFWLELFNNYVQSTGTTTIFMTFYSQH
jgi:hypothetical protein